MDLADAGQRPHVDRRVHELVQRVPHDSERNSRSECYSGSRRLDVGCRVGALVQGAVVGNTLVDCRLHGRHVDAWKVFRDDELLERSHAVLHGLWSGLAGRLPLRQVTVFHHGTAKAEDCRLLAEIGESLACRLLLLGFVIDAEREFKVADGSPDTRIDATRFEDGVIVPRQRLVSRNSAAEFRVEEVVRAESLYEGGPVLLGVGGIDGIDELLGQRDTGNIVIVEDLQDVLRALVLVREDDVLLSQKRAVHLSLSLRKGEGKRRNAEAATELLRLGVVVGLHAVVGVGSRRKVTRRGEGRT